MNSRREFIATSIGGLVAGCSALRSHAHAPKELPRTLLLGDSITIGYIDLVIGILLGKVLVTMPQNENGAYQNCAGTTQGVKKIDTWLQDGNWDVIHFNFGLHDLKHVDAKTGRNSHNPNDPLQANLEQYAENLEHITKKLIATKAKVIFATTTPYLENPGGPLRDADQPRKYNVIALPIMERNGVMVNDLHGFVLPRIKELLPPRNVHPTKAGSLELALQVVAHIEKALAL